MEWYYYVLIGVGILVIGALKLWVFGKMKKKPKTPPRNEED
jgi:hypothetical protein